jgi:hypothetical protein
MLWRDPHAANDCALLLARSAFAEGTAYIPTLYLRAWRDAPPGTLARVAVWIGVMALIAAWLRRCATGAAGRGALRTLTGIGGVVLAGAFLLERWPVAPRGPRFDDALDLGSGTTVFVDGAAHAEDDHLRARAGRVELLVRSRAPLAALVVQAEGQGLLRPAGGPPVLLPGRAVGFELPLAPWRSLTGRRGATETLYRRSFVVERAEDVVVRLTPVSRSGDSAPRP